MRRRYEQELSADLQQVGSRLSEHEIEVDAMTLDRIKAQALTRSKSTSRRRPSMARLATMITTLALVALSGGALAVAQLDTHPNRHGGAASDQYTPGVAQKPTTVAKAPTTVTSATAENESAEGAVTSPSTSAAQSTQTSSTSKTLPFTGAEVLTVVLVGLLLIGSGVLLAQTRARRRQDH